MTTGHVTTNCHIPGNFRRPTIHQRIATTPKEYGPSSIASQFTFDHVTTGILLAQVYVHRSRGKEFAPFPAELSTNVSQLLLKSTAFIDSTQFTLDDVTSGILLDRVYVYR